MPSVKRKPVNPCGTVHVHLVVSDIKRSIDFYTTVLGFFYDHGIKEMAWLQRDGFLLTLAPGLDASAEPQPRQGYFGWALDSPAELERCYQELYQQRQTLSNPPDETVGRSYFFLYDPDGHAIIFSYTALDY